MKGRHFGSTVWLNVTR